jgi:DNA polymerase-1
MNRLLILIDGSAVAYRGYFALIRNPLFNSHGENTSAVFAFANSLIKLIDQAAPTHVCCVFDTPAPTFRHKLYEGYKSTRARMPEDLADSLPWIKEVIEAFRIPVIEMAGYEADDVIGTLALKAAGAGFDVGLFTGDKDFYQLVTDHIKILHPKTYEWHDPEAVKKIYGVSPDKMIDLLALMGDSSDDIPGVPGVGEKTAKDLLEQFGDFETVLKSADKVKKQKISESLTANAELARLSKQLVTIDCNVPIDLTPDTFKLQAPDNQRLVALFKKFEFKGLQAKFASGQPQLELITPKPSSPQQYSTVTSLDHLQKILAEAEQSGECAVDTETTSLVALDAELVGISLSYREGEAYYIPLGHAQRDTNLPLAQTLECFERFFKTATRLIGHNFKYDRQVFDNHHILPKSIYFDTMLASYVINPGRRVHNQAALAQEFFEYRMQPITELIGSGPNQSSFSMVPVNQATFYSCEDADYALRLKNYFLPILVEQKLDSLFFELEMPLMPVLGDMEKFGVAIDVEFLRGLSNVYGLKMLEIEKKIYTEAGQKFNINSPTQLRTILFEKLQLPSGRKTAKGGEKSTDVSVLEKLAHVHPLPKMILDYRQLTKLKSTYIDSLPKLINHRTGRVHTSFNQTVASTGRLSSSDPNLQNIPIRTEEGREIRRAFVAREGFNILSADYSQIELRLMAHFANDSALIAAFERGEDIHRRTAAEVFGVKLEKVSDAMRRSAKTANFAIIYGVSAYGLSQQGELSVKDSQEYIDAYFKRYPSVKKYMDDIKATAREKGYVETLLGRRRYLPDINAKSRQAREFAERTAINTPLQGTAADLIKLAMIRIDNELKSKESKMILQVHDELVFEQRLTEREYLGTMVKQIMEKALKLKVPLKVDLSFGDNWLEAH